MAGVLLFQFGMILDFSAFCSFSINQGSASTDGDGSVKVRDIDRSCGRLPSMRLPVILAALVPLLVAPAYSATISVSKFEADEFDAITSEFEFSLFELLPNQTNYDPVDGSISTRVGVFVPTDTSNLANDQGNFGPDGGAGGVLAVQSVAEFGRTDSTASLGYPTTSGYLSSGGVTEMIWRVSAGGTVGFDHILFNLIDAADAGGTLNINVGGRTWAINGSVLRPDRDGEVRTVLIDIGEFVTSSDVRFSVFGTGFSPYPFDPFGIDNIVLATNQFVESGPPLEEPDTDDDLSPVPLPAAGWMMIIGLCALWGIGRHSSRAVGA